MRLQSLRARLLAGLLIVVAAGVGVASLATHRALSDFLESRLDGQLRDSRPPVFTELSRGGVFPGGSRASGRTVILAGTFAELRRSLGPTVQYVTPDQPRPVMPEEVPGDGTAYFDVDSEQAGFDYRVLSTPLRDGSTLLVALPLEGNRATLHKLVTIEIIVGIFVLAGLGVLATLIVRLGLKPLDEIGATAEAIAAGDLSRRVERAEPTTEVGRLGLALNGMLGQIEDAFSRRQVSEDRLRRFVADASHELRTPLTSIRGYAELFRRGAADRPEDLAIAMRRIEEEAARMGGLVDDLLLLARLDEGRPLERSPVDLTRLATDAVADARAVEPDRPFTLTAPAPVVVSGDEARLRQVVGNLVTNARVHTPPGTPVHVRVTAEGDAARLDVRDEGPGLDPETAGRVFERFYRADKARSRATGGAGLGLSIVAAVAEAHGGSARVETATSYARDGAAGAWFVIELPMAVSAGAPSELEWSP